MRDTKELVGRNRFKKFAGMMNDAEANALEIVINGGCEKIDPDDWK